MPHDEVPVITPQGVTFASRPRRQCCSSLSRAASRSRLRCRCWRAGWVMVPSSYRRASSACSAAFRARRSSRSVSPSGSGTWGSGLLSIRAWVRPIRACRPCRARSIASSAARLPSASSSSRARAASARRSRATVSSCRASPGRAMPARRTRGQGETLHHQGDRDHRDGQDQDQVRGGQRDPGRRGSGMERAAASGTTPRVPAQATTAVTRQTGPRRCGAAPGQVHGSAAPRRPGPRAGWR